MTVNDWIITCPYCSGTGRQATAVIPADCKTCGGKGYYNLGKV